MKMRGVKLSVIDGKKFLVVSKDGPNPHQLAHIAKRLGMEVLLEKNNKLFKLTTVNPSMINHQDLPKNLKDRVVTINK